MARDRKIFVPRWGGERETKRKKKRKKIYKNGKISRIIPLISPAIINRRVKDRRRDYRIRFRGYRSTRVSPLHREILARGSERLQQTCRFCRKQSSFVTQPVNRCSVHANPMSNLVLSPPPRRKIAQRGANSYWSREFPHTRTIARILIITR